MSRTAEAVKRALEARGIEFFDNPPGAGLRDAPPARESEQRKPSESKRPLLSVPGRLHIGRKTPVAIVLNVMSAHTKVIGCCHVRIWIV